MDQITGELHDMLQAAVQAGFVSPKVSAASIQKALRDLQGDNALTGFFGEREDGSTVPFADLADLNGLETLVAAFGILRGGFGIPEVRAYLQFYSRATGVWTLVEETGSEFDSRVFSIARVRSPAPDEAWYVLWGTVVGDTGSRMRVRLYSFDGWEVRTIWQRDDLRGGTLTASEDQIKLDYFERTPEHPPGHHGTHTIETLVPHPTAGLQRIDITYAPN